MTNHFKSINFRPSALFLLLNTLIIFPAIAQDGPGNIIDNKLDINKTVAVIPFSTSFEYDSDQADYSLMLTERIQTALVQTQRFIMVERIDMEKVLNITKKQEEYSQEHEYWENIPDNHLVEAGRQLGVEFIFTGNISNVATSINISGSYTGEFGFTIKVISVETGKIYVTGSFNEGTGKILGGNSKREALNAALEKVIEPVQVFIDKNFPLEVPFLKIGETNKKNLPKTIIIQGGITNGLRQGQRLDIRLRGEGDYLDKIGEVEIIEPSANYSICKVIKGADKIAEHALRDKKRIIVKTIAYEKKGGFK